MLFTFALAYLPSPVVPLTSPEEPTPKPNKQWVYGPPKTLSYPPSPPKNKNKNKISNLLQLNHLIQPLPFSNLSTLSTTLNFFPPSSDLDLYLLLRLTFATSFVTSDLKNHIIGRYWCTVLKKGYLIKIYRLLWRKKEVKKVRRPKSAKRFLVKQNPVLLKGVPCV